MFSLKTHVSCPSDKIPPIIYYSFPLCSIFSLIFFRSMFGSFLFNWWVFSNWELLTENANRIFTHITNRPNTWANGKNIAIDFFLAISCLRINTYIQVYYKYKFTRHSHISSIFIRLVNFNLFYKIINKSLFLAKFFFFRFVGNLKILQWMGRVSVHEEKWKKVNQIEMRA